MLFSNGWNFYSSLCSMHRFFHYVFKRHTTGAVMNRNEYSEIVNENNNEYLTKARLVAMSLAVNQGRVSIHDVKQVLGHVPADVTPSVMRSVFREKKWQKVGTDNNAAVYVLEGLS